MVKDLFLVERVVYKLRITTDHANLCVFAEGAEYAKFTHIGIMEVFA
jgi:hypothetical protein